MAFEYVTTSKTGKELYRGKSAVRAREAADAAGGGSVAVDHGGRAPATPAKTTARRRPASPAKGKTTSKRARKGEGQAGA